MLIERLRSMNADELRFRLTCEARKAVGRLRSGIAAPRWRRADLAGLLSRPDASRLPALDSEYFARARRALEKRDWPSAHRALAAHFAGRAPRFPLDPRTLGPLSERVRRRFPEAAAEASGRAERMLDGRYDILGYRDVEFGAPPDWHRDPIHERRAPLTFWSSVPYLDPQFGDHKVIWEINRHQKWLTLGRAYRLTGDRRYYEGFVEHLEDWLANNPPLRGVNWASMLELALRSLSWLWALHFFADAALDDPPDRAPWTVDLLLALDRQLTHVAHNLSEYFSPNTHLTGEALALYVGGLTLPELAASDRRAALGRRVLEQQVDRQIGADGGHVELSAHYHRYSTDFYLLATLAARINRDSAAPMFEAAAERQAGYLRTITDDRGRLPLIGDDDGGQLFPICGRDPSDCRDTLAAASAILDEPALAVSDIPEEVFWLCSALPLEDMLRVNTPWPSTALPTCGYYVSRTASGDHLIFDAGHHGFLNGGHAHADALSVVLTVGGRPLLVDAGTATYTIDSGMRDRFRATAMHNTIVVDGRPQSEPRGPFHWKSAARARPIVWSSGSDFDYAEGFHDGYLPVVHARGVLAVHGLGWYVIDHILDSRTEPARASGRGRPTPTVEGFWHLHPDWSATAADRGTVMLLHRDGSRHVLASSSDLEVINSGNPDGLDCYAPAYGRIEHAVCLRSRTDGFLPRSFLTFTPATAGLASDVSIVQLDLSKPPDEGWHGSAFRISCGARTAILLASIQQSPAEASGEGPARMWGCQEACTDARVALIHMDASSDEAVRINGHRVELVASSVHSGSDLDRPAEAGLRKAWP